MGRLNIGKGIENLFYKMNKSTQIFGKENPALFKKADFIAGDSGVFNTADANKIRETASKINNKADFVASENNIRSHSDTVNSIGEEIPQNALAVVGKPKVNIESNKPIDDNVIDGEFYEIKQLNSSKSTSINNNTNNKNTSSKNDDFDSWLKKKYSKQQESLNAMAEKGESELKAVAKRLGMDDEQINKMSADDLMKTVKDKNQDRTMNRITSPNVFDKMEYNKIPQKVLGAGISLGAVHSMMNNGGQQTNSQLYNQE